MAGVPQAKTPIAILAGRGALPFAIADAARASGCRVHLIGLTGFADPALAVQDDVHVTQVGRLLKSLRAAGCRSIILCGGLERPGRLRDLRFDWGVLRYLPRLWRVLRGEGGDDRLLRAVARFFHEEGIEVIGVKDIAPDLLTPPGVLTRLTPTPAQIQDSEAGLAALRAMGPFDIGQTLVVLRGRIVAVEAAEGTDAMIERVMALRENGRLPQKRGEGVLIKIAKPGQDMRFDLPTIGPETVEQAAKAGLAGLVLEAGRTIILDREKTLARAETLGLFVYAPLLDPAVA
jgi:UDP-2,3-diacylglucosamine hydrolase